ncbi:MAG: DUF4361 domain-containing protein [Bacteroidales bacterium]|nr:DUF4361 domain-containing protein [Bacteroidales bacterium]MBK8884080.1 DUF4361 domain-containing protein [Bacteroidales bacterium]
MKKLIFSALSLVLAVMTFTSCDNTPIDLITADVKTGGILNPTPSIPYKLGGTPSFDIEISIPKGPGIASIDVYKKYTGKSEVKDQTVSVGSINKTEDASVTVTYDYAQLISGLDMPADELTLTIGDAWTLRYVSVMEDGREVSVGKKSTVTVANKYAGYYQCVGVFTHPVNGPRPINEKKFLTPIDANSCWGNAGDLGASGYFVRLTVDPATNLVVCSTWDNYEMFNQPGNENSYDPATGEFTLSYFYVGATGNRLMDEVWTPVE